MANFGQDAFTGTNDTPLTSHTPDIGTAWQGKLGTLAISDANRARNAHASNNGIYTIQDTPADADYRVGATIYRLSAEAQVAGVTGRWVSDFDTYAITWDDNTDLWQLERWDDGSATILDTYSGDVPDGSGVTCELRMSGTTISALIAGVTQMSEADATYSAAGQAALYISAGSVANDAGLHVDDYWADDVIPGAGESFTTVLIKPASEAP